VVSTTKRKLGKWLAATGAGTYLSLAGGCSISHDTDHNGGDSPSVGRLTDAPLTTALVLSSGGPRGFVHVGVLKALDELGVCPQLVVGASVGSLVAALYAAGNSAVQIEDLALSLMPTSLTRLAIGAPETLSSTAIYTFVRRHCGNLMIEKTARTRLAIAVARRDTGAVTLFTRGDVSLAVQASCAIEGTFTPVSIRGTVYVDPDLHLPLPVRATKAMGIARVLSVDASAHEEKAPEGAQRFRATDLRKRSLTLPDTQAASLNLHPEFGYWVNMSEEFRRRAINAGYQTTMAQQAGVRALLHVG
jgi:NTE family protein